MSLHFLVFELCMWGACLYALLRGDRSERVTALIFLLAVEASYVALRPVDQRYFGLETRVLIVDVAAFCAYSAVALTSRKYWPIWFAATAGVTVLCHLAVLAPGILVKVYWRSTTVWSYVRLAILAEATYFAKCERSGRFYRPFWSRLTLLVRKKAPRTS